MVSAIMSYNSVAMISSAYLTRHGIYLFLSMCFALAKETTPVVTEWVIRCAFSKCERVFWREGDGSARPAVLLT